MNKIKILLPVILLIGLEVIIFITNFQKGTYLIGWDNLMPEFDLALNFKRALFSVWQGYRGLGFLDGLSNAATLTHTFYIWLLSLVLPENLLRYVFTHITHLLGGIGFFFLAKKLTKNHIASFIGALFYMLNLGVIQQFYAPLEAFAIH